MKLTPEQIKECVEDYDTRKALKDAIFHYDKAKAKADRLAAAAAMDAAKIDDVNRCVFGGKVMKCVQSWIIGSSPWGVWKPRKMHKGRKHVGWWFDPIARDGLLDESRKPLWMTPEMCRKNSMRPLDEGQSIASAWLECKRIRDAHTSESHKRRETTFRKVVG